MSNIEETAIGLGSRPTAAGANQSRGDQDGAARRGRTLDSASSGRSKLTSSVWGAGLASLGAAGGMLANDAAASFVRDYADDLNKLAREQQGAAAFESTERATACHEAGHVVVAAALGIPFTGAIIRKRTIRGREAWLGRTNGTPPWSVTPETSIDDDFRQAILVFAGVAAEMILDRDDHRLGSSVNEIATAAGISQSIARKTGGDPREVMMGIAAAAGEIILQNKTAALAVAGHLQRCHSASVQTLAKMLAGVERIGRVR
jgi:hypothetical protein